MAEKNPFMALADEMDLYKDSNDQLLGRTIGHASHTLQLKTTEVVNLLKALRLMTLSENNARFTLAILQVTELTRPGLNSATPVLDRIIEFLSKCASLEEFETIVTKSTLPNN